ncbi:MAG: cytochrome P450 [Pseudomonadota bacterium]|nr:cytochrome P450 [Pseudomonadota bacterium]
MRKLKSWFGAGRAKPAAPELPVDLLSDAFVADPAPTWAWLRDNAPLAPVKSGGYVMTRAADIKAAFTDARLGNAPSRFSMLAEKNRDKYVAADVAANIPPFLDKPRHVEMRKPLSSAFFAAFDGAQDWIDPLAEAHLTRIAGQGAQDIITAYARPFAAQAMARFIGLDHDPEAISRATDALFKLFAPITDRTVFDGVNAGLSATRAYIGEAVAARHAHPGDDLISHLIARGGLTDIEIGDHALLILADGIENIEAAIAQLVLMLHEHPDHRAALAAGEGDVTATVLEVLRLQTPAQTIPRVVREAHERDGVHLTEGTPIFLALGSANRDPDQHENPDDFDPTRDLSDVLLFGQGRHRCIGAPLGQLLVSAATRAMLKRDVALVTDPAQVTYHKRLGHRWPVELRANVT